MVVIRFLDPTGTPGTITEDLSLEYAGNYRSEFEEILHVVTVRHGEDGVLSCPDVANEVFLETTAVLPHTQLELLECPTTRPNDS